MTDYEKGISKDALEITKNLIDLTKELAITNQNLSYIGVEVNSHNKLLYGDEQGKGGILVRLSASEDKNTQHETLLNQLEASCGEVIKSLNAQLLITKYQGDSINRLYKLTFLLIGAVLFIMVSLGLVGWKEITSIISSIGL